VARLHESLSDHDKARSNYLEVEEIAKRSLGNEDPLTIMAMRELGKVCITLKLYDEAEIRLLKANEILKRMDDNALAGAIDVPKALCRLYEAWGKPERAVQYCAKGGDEEP
jgi:tetratricopeptide (TPR) repeat protein